MRTRSGGAAASKRRHPAGVHQRPGDDRQPPQPHGDRETLHQRPGERHDPARDAAPAPPRAAPRELPPAGRRSGFRGRGGSSRSGRPTSRRARICWRSTGMRICSGRPGRMPAGTRGMPRSTVSSGSWVSLRPPAPVERPPRHAHQAPPRAAGVLHAHGVHPLGELELRGEAEHGDAPEPGLHVAALEVEDAVLVPEPLLALEERPPVAPAVEAQRGDLVHPPAGVPHHELVHQPEPQRRDRAPPPPPGGRAPAGRSRGRGWRSAHPRRRSSDTRVALASSSAAGASWCVATTAFHP